MKVINFSEFQNNPEHYLDMVNQNKEIIAVSRRKGKNIVLMDLGDYNALQETLHLTSTEANHKRLTEAIAEMNAGEGKRKRLISK